jgi:ubiquinone/menaquinone biosynthesis C-methylase UbiE
MNITSKDEISSWWAINPMTYGDIHGTANYSGEKFTLGDKFFFEKVDKEFFSWNKPLSKKDPFDLLFPFKDIPVGSRVLEIGCGMGTMASIWAKRGMNVTAIDLNPVAVEQTKRRFELYGLNGSIRMVDANDLPFLDDEFDYVYSWGVLHHSPRLDVSVAELFRVLRPGGHYGVMLYNRNSLAHWYITAYVEGFLNFENQFLGPLELASRYGDGYREEGNPHTWPVTSTEMKHLFSQYSSNFKHRYLGTELDGVLLLLWPGIGKIIPTIFKKVWARRFGWSIWMEGTKS